MNTTRTVEVCTNCGKVSPDSCDAKHYNIEPWKRVICRGMDGKYFRQGNMFEVVVGHGESYEVPLIPYTGDEPEERGFCCDGFSVLVDNGLVGVDSECEWYKVTGCGEGETITVCPLCSRGLEKIEISL